VTVGGYTSSLLCVYIDGGPELTPLGTVRPISELVSRIVDKR